jgi:hypothetical protein
MNKDIYLVTGHESESYAQFRDRMFAAAEAALVKSDPWKLSMTLTVAPPPALSIIPFRKKKIASISVYRADERWIGTLTSLPGFTGAYRVEEALPVAYGKSWSDREVTPGVCLLTLFRRKRGLDHATFINRWHNSHTPLSLRIHPLWHYSRNVVKEENGAKGLPWEGIVEEHTRSRSELLNPFKFFGPFPVIVPRMIEVYRDTKSFLDYGTIETYLVQEYWFRS